MVVRFSKSLLDVLLYLLDVRARQLGLDDPQVQEAVRAVLQGEGHALKLAPPPEGPELIRKASEGLWTLIIDAEQHFLHVGELHEPDCTRLLAETRRLLIDRGYYRRRLLLDREEAEFELNGDQWLWTGRTNRKELDR